MRNRIAAVLFSLFFAVPVFADYVGPFKKFSMGAMLGLGTSNLTGYDSDLYDEYSALGVSLFFRMAVPVTKGMSVLVDIGVDEASAYSSEYEYQHYAVKDSVETTAVEFAVLWDNFFTNRFFVSIGPSIRIPIINERLEVGGDEIFSGEPDYASDLWVDAVFATGWKFDGVEFGLRFGYEFLGFYKETDVYPELEIHVFRWRFYFGYWFGQTD